MWKSVATIVTKNLVFIVAIAMAGTLTVQRILSLAPSNHKPIDLVEDRLGSIDEPYCGLFAVFRSAALLEVDISMSTLLSEKYVSKAGSTGTQLIRAAEDNGLFATPLSGVPVRDLRQFTNPAILHVRSSMDAKRVNHWALYAGTSGDSAVMYGMEEGKSLIPYSTLESMWDGNAILITKNRPALYQLLAPSWSYTFLFVEIGVIAFISLSLHMGQPTLQTEFTGPSPLIKELGLLILVSALIAVFVDVGMMQTGGWFRDSKSIAAVQDRFYGQFIPESSCDDLKLAIKTDSHLLIDARWPEDFARGHLPSALNLPPNTSSKVCEEQVRAANKGRELLVYCQSDRCPYSDRIARKLAATGFDNVRIFRGGWLAWEVCGASHKTE